MVNNNKILTVSYGTFSCTLEGFDDSFGTMKAIAEYFRDLASDDRYFGAEPPQPDAEMLARIAQREVTRRVEAHSENGNFVLRAHEEQQAPVAPASIAAPVAAATAEAAVAYSQPDYSNVPAQDMDVPVQDVQNATPMLDAQQEIPAAPAADHESVAQKLQRIRAVVSKSDVAEENDDYLEDEHADDMVADTPHEADDFVTSLMVEAGDDDAEEEDDAPEAQADDAEEDDAEEDAEEDDTSAENFFAESAPDDDFDDENTAQSDEDETVNVAFDDDDQDDEDDDDDDDDVGELSSHLRARVVKVKRADLEAAIAEGNLEEEDDASDSTLSAEDEAELQRELAAVEANLEEPDTYVLSDAEQQNDDADDHGHTGAKLLAEKIRTDDDLSRLMAETESQMGEPESTSRRDAFAHLRAAVAATKAEETLGGDDDDDDTSDVYRDDLASVVKPRRPEASGVRTQRPAEARPAPLKLVAEQRVDTDNVIARGPVRPRRVGSSGVDTANTSVDEDSDDFIEYAENMGASKLPDLLEAAASYMVFVEGRDQFSRPQLMGKVRMVEQEEFSREDGLRSFGQLLRSGKIEKIKGGRFVVSDRIGFKPDPDDSRAAG